MEDAIAYARRWYPQKKWLLDNGIDVSELPEEIEFQRLYKQTNLENEFKNFLKAKSIEKAIEQVLALKIKEKFM